MKRAGASLAMESQAKRVDAEAGRQEAAAAPLAPLAPQPQPQEPEPLLTGPQRYTVYPIQHDDIWKQYKKQLAALWTAEEIDFSHDREQFNSAALNDAERHFIKSVLAFFAGTDTVVSLNLMEHFCREVRPIEAQIAYTFQAMMENVHAEVYSIMIETFVTDNAEKDALFGRLGDMRSVHLKLAWAERWRLSPDAPFAKRLVGFVIVEGLFFSGAFCAIYWIKQRNLLPGLTSSNAFIARDEGMHTEFGALLYSKVANRLPEDEVRAMFREAVAVEKEFITESIPCRMIGMNQELMAQYIEYVADGLLGMLGYATMFGSKNPFAFMDLIGMDSRPNMFETRPTEYQRAEGGGGGRLAKDSELFVDEF